MSSLLPVVRRNLRTVELLESKTGIRQQVASIINSENTLTKRILGLDINTNSTGYTILDGKGTIVKWGYISTTKFPSSEILDVASGIGDVLKSIRTQVDGEMNTNTFTWNVGIEDFLRTYNNGKFHTKGLFQLAQLNGIVSFWCWKFYGKKPFHTHPTSARAFFDLHLGPKEISVKEKVFQFAQSYYPSFDWEKNRHGRLSDKNFDIADSFVIASFTWYQCLQQELFQHTKLKEEFHQLYMDHYSKRIAQVLEQVKKKDSTVIEEEALIKEYVDLVFHKTLQDWVKLNRNNLPQYHKGQ